LTGSASTAPDGAPFGSLTAAPRSTAQESRCGIAGGSESFAPTSAGNGGRKRAWPYPAYIAFRTADNGGCLLTVVAALEPDDGCRFPWAIWFHEQAPDGEYRKVPGKFFDLGISETIGKTMIESIKGGRPLPSEFETQLPIIE
jgi:hypothetical protein